MPLPISCDCGRTLRVKDELAGRKVRCPSCSKILLVPKPEPDIEEAALGALLEEGPEDVPVARPAPASQAVTKKMEQVRPPAPRSQPAAPPPKQLASVKWPKVRSRGSRRTGPLIVVHREIVTGVLMMVGAVVWFSLAFLAGYIYFYPPIMFVLGLLAVIRGLTGKSDE
jgi:hypothetical protein